jgi:hypothetical protein
MMYVSTRTYMGAAPKKCSHNQRNELLESECCRILRHTKAVQLSEGQPEKQSRRNNTQERRPKCFVIDRHRTTQC